LSIYEIALHHNEEKEYLCIQEKKSNEIPKVAASEMGGARLCVARMLEELPGKVSHRR